MAHDEGGISGTELTDEEASQVINELVDDYEERAKGYQAVALRNERLLHGNMEGGFVSGRGLESETGPVHVDLEGRRPRNYMRKLWQTYAARLTEELPFAKAYPNENSGYDIAAAKVANAYLSSQMARLEWAPKIFEAACIAQAHGLVYFKTTWDPSAGQTAFEDEGPPGDVHIELGDIFNVCIDDVDNPHDARWCIFRREVDEYEAEEIYEEFGIDGRAQLEGIKSRYGDKKQGIMLNELWYIPSPRFPDGLFALQVGGKIVHMSAYPYQHGGKPQVPLSCWRIQSIRGVPFGDTHVNDAVPIQIAVNEHSKAIADMTRETGNVRIIAHNKIAGQMRRSNHIIKVNDVNLVNAARYLDPPKPPDIIFGQLDELITALHDLFGQNELLLGRRVGDQSGKSLAYLNRLDGLAMAGSLNNLNAANQRTARQILLLAQQYVDVPRLIAIEGANADETEVVMFTGADIAGATDVRIEAASGNELLSSGRAAEAEEQMAAGLLPPDQGLERSETGLETTQGELVQRQMVQRQIEFAAQGNEVEADSTLDPVIALDEIGERVAWELERGSPPQVIDSLMRLASKYQSVLARAQNPQPAPEPAGGEPAGGDGTLAEQDLPGVRTQF